MNQTRTFKKFCATLTAWCFMTAVAQATGATHANQSREVAQAGAICSDAITQTAMNQCAARAYQTEDKLLNQNYIALKAQLSAEQKRKLKGAQRAWLKYRDAHCDFESARYEGGSIYPLVLSGCMQQLTQQRNVLLSESLAQTL